LNNGQIVVVFWALKETKVVPFGELPRLKRKLSETTMVNVGLASGR
jgi:hypothetical protein